MLRIFKAHSCNTCVLDDFGFYDARQKIMQEKKAKQQPFDKQASCPFVIECQFFDNVELPFQIFVFPSLVAIFYAFRFQSHTPKAPFGWT